MDNRAHQLAISGLLYLTMQEGLRIALCELAKLHNGKPGAWLDQIEIETVDGLKGSSTEGLDMTVEANALKGALAVTQIFFAEFRGSLAPDAESN